MEFARNTYFTDIKWSLSISDKYKNLQVEYQEAVKTAQEQKQLITQLEEDLRSVNALSSMFRGTPEGQNVLTPGGEAEMVAEVVKDVAAPGNRRIFSICSLENLSDYVPLWTHICECRFMKKKGKKILNE